MKASAPDQLVELVEPTALTATRAPSRIAWLRDEVATLERQIAEWDATAAHYRADHATTQQLINDTRLGDDENVMLARRIHIELLNKELARIRAERAPAAQKFDVLRGELGDEENKLASARATVETLHTVGLAHPRYINSAVREVVSEYRRALGTLERAGEPVAEQPIPVGMPRWVGRNTPTM
jgi:multidrug resistance efflux pump